MEIIIKTEEAESEIASNIGALAKILEKKGLDLKEIDRAVFDCWQYIEKRVGEMGLDKTLTYNTENIVIMGLMLGSLRRSIDNRNAVAEKHGISRECLDREDAADMEALLTGRTRVPVE